MASASHDTAWDPRPVPSGEPPELPVCAGGAGLWLPRGLVHNRCTMGVWCSFQLQLSPPPTPPTGTLQHPQALTVRRATLPAPLGQLPLNASLARLSQAWGVGPSALS